MPVPVHVPVKVVVTVVGGGGAGATGAGALGVVELHAIPSSTTAVVRTSRTTDVTSVILRL
jgi:hypothetical protein